MRAVSVPAGSEAPPKGQLALKKGAHFDYPIRILAIQLVYCKQILITPPQILLASHNEMSSTSLARFEVRHGSRWIDLEDVI